MSPQEYDQHVHELRTDNERLRTAVDRLRDRLTTAIESHDTMQRLVLDASLDKEAAAQRERDLQADWEHTKTVLARTTEQRDDLNKAWAQELKLREQQATTINWLKAEIEVRLDQYGKHAIGCYSRIDKSSPCTCGFEAAKRVET